MTRIPGDQYGHYVDAILVRWTEGWDMDNNILDWTARANRVFRRMVGPGSKSTLHRGFMIIEGSDTLPVYWWIEE